jgi:hypothetical protein
MYPIIEQLANDAGISPDNADYIFTVIASHLVSKIPGLGQIIEDIFTNADAEQLKGHINKMIALLQQQGMEQFKTWTTPRATYSIRETGTDHIL